MVVLKKCQLHNIPLSGVTDPTSSAISKLTESTLLCVQFYFQEKICDFIFANSPKYAYLFEDCFMCGGGADRGLVLCFHLGFGAESYSPTSPLTPAPPTSRLKLGCSGHDLPSPAVPPHA